MKYGFAGAALHACSAESFKTHTELLKLSPWLNPQNAETLELEAVMGALDAGAGCAAFSSSWGAWSRLMQTLFRTDGNVLVSRRLCAATLRILSAVLKDLGTEIRYIDSVHPCQTQKTIDENTYAVVAPSLSAPDMGVAALESIARIAGRWGVPFIADNSLATPALCSPAERGAHAVVTSAGGFLAEDGASDVCFVTDAGTFNWNKYGEKFPWICAEDKECGGAVFARDFSAAPLAAKLMMLSMRGAESRIPVSETAALAASLHTLLPRMERQSAAAAAAAKTLEVAACVTGVCYPGLESYQQNDMAEVYLKNGFGAVLSFTIAGGAEAEACFIGALSFIRTAANAGGPRSAIFRASSGGAEKLCLSTGLEDASDITADLENALKAAAGE